MHGFLTEIDTQSNVTPSLAESWEASPDARQWRFTLRKGAEFHNGKPLTAEDVVASINYHRGEESKSAGAPLVAGIENIQADGSGTVVVELSSGNAD
ncbi:MAG TPA: peptide ABC transporter substrate-binding protein, partial [Roseovarius nubinhibens]|nr:peptide ABC transporter substrate-binding protein [Roseovarius nubinhibens]